MPRITIYLFLFILLFTSCKKQPSTVDLLKGNYSLKYASIDGEDVTGYLTSDSVNMYRLFTAEIENTHPFIFYFRPYLESYYTHESSFQLIGNNKIVIKRLNSGEDSNASLNDNLAFIPFAKQDDLTLNIETLTENQLIFYTIYSGKTYRYDFKE
ncbi:hypothetical protein HNS38_08970 [Lentimicrobium sp. L6]|uniref:hypothetical protein n=1 Tax=Lentimicrobium sp. L6 TaxID=2735916 RepID=UPI0015581ECD|nr:hypothetical protein [Lentimicrobium sp. L6]NPD84887.1 hypothetical protein [Lentimicrobium sp. L6]